MQAHRLDVLSGGGEMLGRILVLLACVLASPAALAFDYFEHRYVGNRAYEEAIRAVVGVPLREALVRVGESRLRFGWRPLHGNANMAARLLTRLPLQFGDLAALAGDFADDPRDLRRLLEEFADGTTRKPSMQAGRAEILIINTRQQWLSACKWIHRTRIAPHGAVSNLPSVLGDGVADDNVCFDTLENTRLQAPVHRFGSEGYRPSREELAERERISKYVALASINRKHFPRHSWKAYSDHHNRALELARCFRDGPKCAGWRAPGDDLLVEAIVEEAFAQHYLHDSFASGHIGTKWGRCSFLDRLFCSPTKVRLHQTHDVLNELGLDVKLMEPQDYLDDTRETVSRRWTSFGDDHLLIPAADFHRAVILRTAIASIREVLDHADASKNKSSCQMCTTRIFPVPLEYLSRESEEADSQTDLTQTNYPVGDLVEFEETRWLFFGEQRSFDHRVPGIPLEGWKVGFGIVWQYREAGSSKYDGGAMLSLDYLRSTGDNRPNTYGFEFWNVPDRGSAYLGTAGFVWPEEVAAFQLSVKAKFGWRTEENFTKNNPGSTRRGGLQLTFPSLEANYDVYRPVSLFAQLNVFTYVFRGGEEKTESLSKGNFTFVLIGAKVDLSGVR